MATSTDITYEQLLTVDPKLLFKALEERYTSAGLIGKKKGTKKASVKKTASSDDAASESGSQRSVGAGTKAWNEISSAIIAITKEVLGERKPGVAGFYLKVAGYMKKQAGGTLSEVPAKEAIAEAVEFLLANPDYKSDNQKAKETKKTASSDDEGETSTAAASASAAAAKKRGPKAKSEEQKAAEKAEKEAKKAAEKEAKAAAKAAEKEAKKAEKKAEKAPAKPAPKPQEEEEEDDEEAAELATITHEGKEYYWNQETGDLYESVDGGFGDKVGTYDGISFEFD